MSDLRNDYLAAYRRSVQSPAGVREANLQAILDRAAAIEAEAAPTRWAASAVFLKLTTVVVVGAGLGWGVVAATPSETPAAPAPVAMTTVAPPAVDPPAPPPVVAPPVVAAPEAVRTVAPPPPPPSPVVSPADLLREELALLEAAQAQLSAGDLERAERSLAEHARRFPQGTLAIERSAWKAIASCSGGGAQPQAAARSFILTHGDTPLAAKVKSECEL